MSHAHDIRVCAEGRVTVAISLPGLMDWGLGNPQELHKCVISKAVQCALRK